MRGAVPDRHLFLLLLCLFLFAAAALMEIYAALVVLVPLQMEGGAEYLAAVQRIWDAGDAVAPLPVDAPPPHLARLLATLAPQVLIDNNATLWSGFAIVGPAHRVYYSGDTGLFPALRDIGAKYGPFDCTLIEIGQYHRAWPDWHIGPEQAIEAHTMLRGRVLLPVHWGLFRLAYHGWTEPIERAAA